METEVAKMEMELEEEATSLLSVLTAKAMLDVVGAVLSARFEVILLYPMPWNFSLEIEWPVQHYNVFLKSLFIRLATDDELCLLRSMRLRIL